MGTAYAGPMTTALVPAYDDMWAFVSWWFRTCNHGRLEIGWTNPATGDVTSFAQFGLGEWEDLVKAACERNAIPGTNVYVRGATVAAATSGRYTMDRDVVQVPGAWGDLDDGDATARALAIAAPKPNARIITGRLPSERTQFLWQLTEPLLGPEWARDLNRQILAKFGGDRAVINPSRLLRLGGSIAWPYKVGRLEPELTEFVPATGVERHTFTLSGLKSRLPPLPVAADAPPLNGHINGHAAPNGGTTKLLNPIKGLIQEIQAGPVWHDPTVRLVAKLVHHGRLDVEILGLAHALTWPNFTVDETHADLAKMIKGARTKDFGQPDFEYESDASAAADVMDVPPKTPPLFPLLTDDDLAAMPDPTWLIPGVLVDNTMSIVYGLPGALKSFWALHTALCLATGLDWFGRPVGRVDVLYLAGEGAAGLKLRVAAWKQHHGITHSIVGFRVVPLAVNLMDEAEAKRLVLTATAAPKANGFAPGLVIADTLHRSMPGADENSAKDMGVAIANAAKIQRALGCSFMPIHHAGKDQERGMRGSNALLGAADAVFRVTRTDDQVSLLVEKQKDAEDGQTLAFRSLKVDLPRPEGSLTPRDSLVLVEDVPAEPAATASTRPPLPPSRTMFHAALVDAIIAHPTGRGETTRTAWEAECLRRDLIDAPPPNETGAQKHKRRTRYRTAKSALLEAGWIGIDGERVSDLTAKY